MTRRETFTWILAILFVFKVSDGLETDLTIEIDAGRQECFHQFISKGSSVEFEYQVKSVNLSCVGSVC